LIPGAAAKAANDLELMDEAIRKLTLQRADMVAKMEEVKANWVTHNATISARNDQIIACFQAEAMVSQAFAAPASGSFVAAVASSPDSSAAMTLALEDLSLVVDYEAAMLPKLDAKDLIAGDKKMLQELWHFYEQASKKGVQSPTVSYELMGITTEIVKKLVGEVLWKSFYVDGRTVEAANAVPGQIHTAMKQQLTTLATDFKVVEKLEKQAVERFQEMRDRNTKRKTDKNTPY
jgi:hypothetical protein